MEGRRGRKEAYRRASKWGYGRPPTVTTRPQSTSPGVQMSGCGPAAGDTERSTSQNSTCTSSMGPRSSPSAANVYLLPASQLQSWEAALHLRIASLERQTERKDEASVYYLLVIFGDMNRGEMGYGFLQKVAHGARGDNKGKRWM
ncbi:hypothetical protein BDQ17DRAFT_1332028 [Cyathus striatus]|nr:hypothetical protein BDQ17DRAFT_1332028 [Cyathus striatus]